MHTGTVPQHLPLPKYHQVYLLLREQLAEGRFAEGVPGEFDLMKSFGVARVTVRRALERLANDGLIQRSPGRGTVALAQAQADAAPALPDGHAPLHGLLQSIVEMGWRSHAKVLLCQQLAAPWPVATRLAIGAGAQVQKVVRLRSTRSGPVSHITTYTPLAAVRAFRRSELARKPILVLLQEAGIEIGRTQQSISARLADAAVAQALGLDLGSALLAVERIVFDAGERPVLWLQGLYRPDRYRYVMQLSRVGDIDAQVWVSQSLAEPFH